jgi:cell division protein FtsB
MVTVPNGKIEVSKDGIKLGWNVLSIVIAVVLGWYITATITPLEAAIAALNSTLTKIEARQEADTRALNDKQIVCTQNIIQLQSNIQAFSDRLRRAEDAIDIQNRSHLSSSMTGMGGMGDSNAKTFAPAK